MRVASVMLIAMLMMSGSASAGRPLEASPSEFVGPRRWNTLWAYWDMSAVTGFTTLDYTVSLTPHFHISSYMAFDATDHWWCGSFDYDGDGGYGNGWDDRLELPPVDVSAAAYPVLSFAHYYDSESGYDRTYVQARKDGPYTNLHGGYSGRIPGGAWADLGTYGYELTGVDEPAEVRFRFISDGASSDEDGQYLSAGGAYHVDNIRIFDFYGGTIYFHDDVNSGSPCRPAVPTAPGGYWHVVNDVCSSHIAPSWWCGDDADTSHIPPNTQSAVVTPVVVVPAGARSCTLRYALHAEVPATDSNDYWDVSVGINGAWWISLGTWFGDFGSCYGWSAAGLEGEPLDMFLSPFRDTHIQFRLTFYTSDDGCGPGAAGGAGINLDDTWFEGYYPYVVPVESRSWGSIKALYR